MSGLLLVPAFAPTNASNASPSFGGIRDICQKYIQDICDGFDLSKEVVLENIQDTYGNGFDELFDLFTLYCRWTDEFYVALADPDNGLPGKIANIDSALTACFHHIAALINAPETASGIPVAEIEACLPRIEGLLVFLSDYVTLQADGGASGALIDWRNSLASLEATIKATMSPPDAGIPPTPDFNITFNSGFLFQGGTPYTMTPKDSAEWQAYTAAIQTSFNQFRYSGLLKNTVNISSIDALLCTIIDFAAWLHSFSETLKETIESLRLLETDASAALRGVDLETSRNNWSEALRFAGVLQQL